MVGRPDHPRSRGVYTTPTRGLSSSPGSSPLARGLRRGPGREDRERWIIPARAGFTQATPRRAAAPADHPRSRGVYPNPVGLTTNYFRIIPARAGFTCRGFGAWLCQWDHPRSRGVYLRTCCCRPMFSGSSPLARGLRPHHSQAGIRGGIIPARAGFTGIDFEVTGGLSDHPRSRGVYKHASSDLYQTTGSSPLARGLPYR